MLYTLKRKLFFSFCFLVAPIKVYKKVIKFSFKQQKEIWVLVFSFMYLVLVDPMIWISYLKFAFFSIAMWQKKCLVRVLNLEYLLYWLDPPLRIIICLLPLLEFPICFHTLPAERVFCYQNCSDLLWEEIVLVIGKKIKFEAEGQEFANILRSLEQFVGTVKGQNNWW